MNGPRPRDNYVSTSGQMVCHVLCELGLLALASQAVLHRETGDEL